MKHLSWGKIGGLLAATIFMVATAACTPDTEPMTVDEACKAYEDLNRNSPKSAEQAGNAYYMDHYLDLSTQIDGALGQAFGDLAEFYRLSLQAPDGIAPVEDYHLLRTGILSADQTCGVGVYSEEFIRMREGS